MLGWAGLGWAGLGWAGLSGTNIKLKLLSLSEKMKKVFTGNN